MTATRSDITGIILVGGKSRRMGTDKAFLDFGGQTLFEKVFEAFETTFPTIALVGGGAARFAAYDLPVWPDLYQGSAMGGLYTGLYHAETEHIFVSSCDLPFPSSEVIHYLCSLADEHHDAVVPLHDYGYEPLFAVYSKRCLKAMKAMLEKPNYCVYDLYPEIMVRDVTEEELRSVIKGPFSFLNVNTPAEYEAAKEQQNENGCRSNRR
jgi:molybdopterin-guanine dinucleotide biosynthesis protein A